MLISKRFIRRFILISILFFSLMGCRFFISLSGPIPIEYSGSTLVIAWDNNESGIEGAPSTTAYFNIFYRELGEIEWKFLDATTDSQSTISIQYGTVGNGDFEFAVQAVHNNEETSVLHCSSDFSAHPLGGWYVKWRR